MAVSAYQLPGGGYPFQPTLEMTLRGHRQGVRSVAFQPSSAFSSIHHRHPSSSVALIPKLISGGMDGSVMLWDTTATARAVRLQGHRGPVLSVSQSRRAELFASGGQDGYVRVWVPNLRRSATSFSALSPSYSLTPSMENRVDDSVCGWRAHTGSTRAVAFAKDGSDRLYSVGYDKTVKAWDVAYASSTTRQSKRGVSNKFVGSFHMQGGGNSSRYECGHTNRVASLAVQNAATSSSFFHYVASGGEDGVIFVWDTRTRGAVHVLYDCSGGVNALSFHPDGFVLASGDACGDVNLFDLRRSSASASSAATARRSGTAPSLFHAGGSYSLLQHYHAAHNDGQRLGTQSVDFAPNGGWLLSAGGDNTTKLWDVKEGHLYCTVQAHDGPVTSCCFSENGEWFATSGGVDKTVLVWRSGLAGMYDGVTEIAAATVAAPSVQFSSEAATEPLPSDCTSSSFSRVKQISAGNHGAAAASRLNSHLTTSAATDAPGSFSSPSSSSLLWRGRASTPTSARQTDGRSASHERHSSPSRPPLPFAPPRTPTAPLTPSEDALVHRERRVAMPERSNLESGARDLSKDAAIAATVPSPLPANDDARERSFERDEVQYNHLVTPSSVASRPAHENAEQRDATRRAVSESNAPAKTNGQTPAFAARAIQEAEEREQEALVAQERAHHQEQEQRITQERLANLEDAVAALVAYMKRQHDKQEAQIEALRTSSEEQASKTDTTLTELMSAVELLTAHVQPATVSAASSSTNTGAEVASKEAS